MIYQLFTDGGSRGNPGNAACAAILKDEKNTLLSSESKYLDTQTNNVAEYEGLQLGLNLFLKNLDTKDTSIDKLLIYMDSQLVVRQIQGKYKVKDVILKQKYLVVKKILDEIRESGIKWEIFDVRREANSLADKLVNEELDKNSLN